MMSDQAQLLRQMMNKEQEVLERSTGEMHIITIASGKGGVGKSNFSVNLALALKEMGKNPIILDADFGLANVEILLGEQPQYNLSHLIRGECGIKEVVTRSKHGISFISGGSGIQEMNFLSTHQITKISHELAQLSEFTDILIIDTGAGINDIVVKFCNLSDQLYIVVTPEPPSITDGYALLKTLISQFDFQSTAKLVINKAESQKEAHEVFKKLSYVCEKFLKFNLHYAGFIPYDDQLFKAVKEQIPLVKYAPHSKASHAYYQMATLCMASLGISIEKIHKKESWMSRLKKCLLNDKNS